MKFASHALLYTSLVLGFFVIAGGLGGCADTETKPVPFLVETPPAPIVNECDPKGRVRFPAVEKVEGNKTPQSNLSDAYIAAKAANVTNYIREKRCWCAQVEERGSDAQKARAAKMCGAKTAPAASSQGTLLTTLSTLVGSPSTKPE